MPNSNPDWSEVLPPEGHPRLGREILRIVGDVIEDKLQLGLTEKWLKEYRLARGAHWDKPSSKVPLKTANFVYTHIQRTVNTLTDNNPTFNVSQAGDAEDADIYAKLQMTAEYWWNETEQQSVLERSVRNGETYGVTIEKVIFNPDIEYGIGDVEAVIVDPFHFGVYPVKCTDIQKAEIVLHFYPMTVREARRRWPEFADKIKGDGQYLEELGSERREIAAGGTITRNGQTILHTMSSVVSALVNKATGSATDDGDEETLVVEAWCKDYTIEGDHPKYRGFIRRVTACAAGLLVVDDRSNPSISDALPDEMAQLTYLYDKFPFALANSISEADYLWGISDLEQLDSLQVEINKTISQIAFHKDGAVRPKVVNPKDSGVPNEHFTNISGILNPSSSLTAQGLRYLEMQNNQRDMLETFTLYKELFFQVAGTFELDQAQAPGKSVIAYKAIAALLERASTMMRGKIRNYSKLVRDRGRMFLSLMMNYYTEDRWITYDDAGETHAMQIRGTQMIVPNKLTVVSGSTMPQSKIQQREEALELFKMGAIDQEELLEKIDWSGRAAVIRRMQAGPLHDFLERLAALGFDEGTVQMLQELGMMPREDFDKKAEAGELPTLQAPQLDQGLALAFQEKAEEIEKLKAETQLLLAKVQAEQMAVKQAEEQLEIDRVKTLAGIRNTERDQSLKARAQVHAEESQGEDRELKAKELEAKAKEKQEAKKAK